MMSKITPNCIICCIVGFLLIAGGCAPTPEDAVNLSLKFQPQQKTSYKVLTESQMSLQFEGFDPNSRELEVTVTATHAEIKSTLESGANENEFKVEVSTSLDGVEFKVEYETENGTLETEREFEVEFQEL